MTHAPKEEHQVAAAAACHLPFLHCLHRCLHCLHCSHRRCLHCGHLSHWGLLSHASFEAQHHPNIGFFGHWGLLHRSHLRHRGLLCSSTQAQDQRKHSLFFKKCAITVRLDQVFNQEYDWLV